MTPTTEAGRKLIDAEMPWHAEDCEFRSDSDSPCDCGLEHFVARAEAEAVEAERDRLRRLIAVGHPHVRSAATYPGVDAVMREDVLALLRDPNEHVDPDSSCESCRSIAAEENA